MQHNANVGLMGSGPSVPYRTWRFKSSHPHWFFLGLVDSLFPSVLVWLVQVGRNWEHFRGSFAAAAVASANIFLGFVGQ